MEMAEGVATLFQGVRDYRDSALILDSVANLRRYQFAAEIWTLSKRDCVATLAYAPAEFGQFTSDDNNVGFKKPIGEGYFSRKVSTKIQYGVL